MNMQMEWYIITNFLDSKDDRITALQSHKDIYLKLFWGGMKCYAQQVNNVLIPTLTVSAIWSVAMNSSYASVVKLERWDQRSEYNIISNICLGCQIIHAWAVERTGLVQTKVWINSHEANLIKNQTVMILFEIKVPKQSPHS